VHCPRWCFWCFKSFARHLSIVDFHVWRLPFAEFWNPSDSFDGGQWQSRNSPTRLAWPQPWFWAEIIRRLLYSWNGHVTFRMPIVRSYIIYGQMLHLLRKTSYLRCGSNSYTLRAASRYSLVYRPRSSQAAQFFLYVHFGRKIPLDEAVKATRTAIDVRNRCP